MEKKRNIETLPAAFTDLFAVIIRLSVEEGIIRWGFSPWKLNCNLLTYKCILGLKQEHWEKWKQQKRTFLNDTLWWVQYCKKKI
jgi:hypothetical protein